VSSRCGDFAAGGRWRHLLQQPGGVSYSRPYPPTNTSSVSLKRQHTWPTLQPALLTTTAPAPPRLTPALPPESPSPLDPAASLPFHRRLLLPHHLQQQPLLIIPFLPCVLLDIKGTVTRDFLLWFFHQTTSPCPVRHA
jgi:hypothetical protein